MDHADTLSQIALVLAMAFAGGALLRQLNQPALVGYILVGIFMGPSVLGVVHNETDVTLLAELGILLLMFIIGMELDLKSFGKVYKIAINTTLVQLFSGLTIAFILGIILEWPVVRILLIGFAVTLSSTAVALKMLESLNESDTAQGRAAIGILVAQDLAVIPMLLIISAFEQQRFEPWDLLKIGVAMALLIGVIHILRKHDFKISRPSWLAPASSGEGELTVIKAMAYCFSAAALTGALGLSASYGAFISGLIIGSLGKREKYEAQLRPIFDILMMVFFLSVGLLIDFGFIAENWAALLFMLLTVMLMKTVINIGVLRYLGLSRRNSLIIGAVLGQIGEFSFVLAALGLSINAIEPEGYKFVVALIALSLVSTPVWLYVLRRMRLIRKQSRHRKKTERRRIERRGVQPDIV